MVEGLLVPPILYCARAKCIKFVVTTNCITTKNVLPAIYCGYHGGTWHHGMQHNLPKSRHGLGTL